jgi:hypothetical protein
MRRNIPVPAGPRAAASHRWLWWIGPPALITLAYRLIPPSLRRLWNPRGGATSHLALAAILAGGGWSAFWLLGRPFSMVSQPHRRTPWTLNFIAEPNMWWLPQPGNR